MFLSVRRTSRQLKDSLASFSSALDAHRYLRHPPLCDEAGTNKLDNIPA